MNYNEVASGGTTAAGCVLVAVWHPSIMAFGVGDTLYNIAKARRGVLEKVVIKTMRSTVSKRTLGAQTTLYVDTLNGLWNEWDLIPLSKAQALVAAFEQKFVDDLAKLGAC